jgi:hypothetical protein
MDWYSKHQVTVEMATYRSAFVAARIAADQMIDLHTSLGYMGIEVNTFYMCVDNQLVITSFPH